MLVNEHKYQQIANNKKNRTWSVIPYHMFSQVSNMLSLG